MQELNPWLPAEHNIFDQQDEIAAAFALRLAHLEPLRQRKRSTVFTGIHVAADQLCDLLHRGWVLLVDAPNMRLGCRKLTHFHERARIQRLKLTLLRECLHDSRRIGEITALEQFVAVRQRCRRVLLVVFVGAPLEIECLVAFALSRSCKKAVGSRLRIPRCRLQFRLPDQRARGRLKRNQPALRAECQFSVTLSDQMRH